MNDTDYLWWPSRWRKSQKRGLKNGLDPELWGPAPTWWTYARCAFWNWRRKWQTNVVHWIVCGWLGHDEIWREPTEFDWNGHFACARCPSWKRSDGTWCEIW